MMMTMVIVMNDDVDNQYDGHVGKDNDDWMMHDDWMIMMVAMIAML